MSSEIPPASTGGGGTGHAKQRADRVRVMALLYRKPGMSIEDFHNYWRDEHSKIFAGIAVVKKNLLKYEQIHLDNEASEGMQKMGLPCADYDGMAVFDAASMEKIQEVFADKEYHEVVVPDEEKFIDRQKSVMFPARLVDVFDDPS